MIVLPSADRDPTGDRLAMKLPLAGVASAAIAVGANATASTGTNARSTIENMRRVTDIFETSFNSAMCRR